MTSGLHGLNVCFFCYTTLHLFGLQSKYVILKTFIINFELVNLHERILSLVFMYGKVTFDEILKMYGVLHIKVNVSAQSNRHVMLASECPGQWVSCFHCPEHWNCQLTSESSQSVSLFESHFSFLPWFLSKNIILTNSFTVFTVFPEYEIIPYWINTNLKVSKI